MFADAEVTEVTLGQRVRRGFQESVVTPAKIAWSDWRTKTGIVLLSFIGIAGLFTWLHQIGYEVLNRFLGFVGIPWRLHEPTSAGEYAGAPYVQPFETLEHPLGTDFYGVDLLASTLWATPFMIQMIAAGAIFTIVMATVVGIVAGYKGGTVERVLMTASDIALSIPGLPLVAVLVSIINTNNPFLLGVLITANVWAGLGRTIHSQVLSLRENSYVEASRTMGISTPTILRKDILPNLMPYIAVNVTYAARRVVYDSVALYYLGILTGGATNWGKMMRDAVYEFSALEVDANFHTLVVPTIPIILLSLGLIIFAQGTDRLFNPRVRTRHEGETKAEEHGDEDNVQMGI